MLFLHKGIFRKLICRQSTGCSPRLIDMQMRNRYPEASLTPVKFPLDCRAHGVLAANASTDPDGPVARRHALHIHDGMRRCA